MRIPPSVLKQHNKRDDAWSAFNGKVYNITPYLAFHPGGERELMRVAGRDGTKLFGRYGLVLPERETHLFTFSVSFQPLPMLGSMRTSCLTHASLGF